MDKFAEIRVPIAHNNPSIKRKESKCVLCGKCKDVCAKLMGVAGFWKYDREDVVCINCGQCANFCPVGAITEFDNTNEFLAAVNDPSKKVAVVVAPATRVSLGEEFGLPAGEFVVGKLAGAVKALGADFVFDVAFGADLTVMEEATEFIARLNSNSNLPLFTSCCPAWVKFVQTFYPQNAQNLSTCKSPIAMQAAVLKNYYAHELGVELKNLVVVAITPCTAKKMEAKREDLKSIYGQETDIVLTVRELARLIKTKNIDFDTLQNSQFDKPFDCSSGTGVMFGASGGVTQAVVRTAYYLTTGKNPPEELLNFKQVRGVKGIKTATIKLLNKDVNLCVVSGTSNARDVLNKLQARHYDFVEVMACPNGCVGGGGQPRQENNKKAVRTRGEKLFGFDKLAKTKSSYQNEEIAKIYGEYLGEPMSEKAIKLLHTTYNK